MQNIVRNATRNIVRNSVRNAARNIGRNSGRNIGRNSVRNAARDSVRNRVGNIAMEPERLQQSNIVQKNKVEKYFKLRAIFCPLFVVGLMLSLTGCGSEPIVLRGTPTPAPTVEEMEDVDTLTEGKGSEGTASTDEEQASKTQLIDMYPEYNELLSKVESIGMTVGYAYLSKWTELSGNVNIDKETENDKEDSVLMPVELFCVQYPHVALTNSQNTLLEKAIWGMNTHYQVDQSSLDKLYRELYLEYLSDPEAFEEDGLAYEDVTNTFITRADSVACSFLCEETLNGRVTLEGFTYDTNKGTTLSLDMIVRSKALLMNLAYRELLTQYSDLSEELVEDYFKGKVGLMESIAEEEFEKVKEQLAKEEWNSNLQYYEMWDSLISEDCFAWTMTCDGIDFYFRKNDLLGVTEDADDSSLQENITGNPSTKDIANTDNSIKGVTGDGNLTKGIIDEDTGTSSKQKSLKDENTWLKISIPYYGNEALFRKRFLQKAEQYGQMLRTGEKIWIDADGDGNRELLCLTTKFNEMGLYNKLGVYVNNASVTKDIEAVDLSFKLLHMGENIYLYVFYTKEDSQQSMLVYRLKTSGPVAVMEKDLGMYLSDEFMPYTGYEELTDPNCFRLVVYSDLFTESTCYQRYYVNDKGEPIPEKDYYYYENTTLLTMLQDLEVCSIDEKTGDISSEKHRLVVGDEVETYGTDLKTYVDLKCSDGSIVRIYVQRMEEDGSRRIDGILIEDIFEGGVIPAPVSTDGTVAADELSEDELWKLILGNTEDETENTDAPGEANIEE